MPLYSSILDFLFYRGVAGATVTKGIAGFGADHHMHAAHLVEISDRLPIKIEFIESREKVDALLGKLEELAGSGLIEMQETTVAKPAQLTKPKAPPPAAAHLKIEGKAQMMRIFVSEEDRWKAKPLYEALVEAMRANDIAGVTVYRGILGYGAHRRVHKDKPLSPSAPRLHHAFGHRHGGKAARLSALGRSDGARRGWWSSPTWTSSSMLIARWRATAPKPIAE